MIALWLIPTYSDVKVPDLLKETAGEYYDQDGFSFAPRLAVSEGLASFEIHYQNRFSGDCVARVICWPVDGLCKTGQHDVPPVTTEVRCEGGEVGVVRIPYAIGARWQGKEMIYDVACSADFPNGQGIQISDCAGMRVGHVRSDNVETLVMVAHLFTGRLRRHKPAAYRVVLPNDVGESTPVGMKPTTEIRHRPDLASALRQERADAK